MQDFLNPSLCRGEISYFLVTYCTSLALISCLSEETLLAWLEGDFEASFSEPEAQEDLQHDQEEPSDPPKASGDDQTSRKRSRTTSLIEVDLTNQPEQPQSHLEASEEQTSEFLSWASSLIRK